MAENVKIIILTFYAPKERSALHEREARGSEVAASKTLPQGGSDPPAWQGFYGRRPHVAGFFYGRRPLRSRGGGRSQRCKRCQARP